MGAPGPAGRLDPSSSGPPRGRSFLRVSAETHHQRLLAEGQTSARDEDAVQGQRQPCCSLSVFPWVCPGLLLPLLALLVAIFPDESHQLRNELGAQLGAFRGAARGLGAQLGAALAPGPGADDAAPSASLPQLKPPPRLPGKDEPQEPSPEPAAAVASGSGAGAEVAALTDARAGPSAGARSNASAGQGSEGSVRASATTTLRTTTGSVRAVATTRLRTTTTLSTTVLSTTPSAAALQCDECTPAVRDRPNVMIPVFERDLCKLRATARSIVEHDPDRTLGKIFVCWVSGKSRYEFASQLDEITHILEEHGDVEVLEMPLAGMTGWMAQQSAKLKVASRVLSEYYIVLDAKNMFLMDIGPETFLTPCNQGKVFGRYDIDNMPAEHRGWFGTSAGVLGQQVMDWGKWPASVTPMVLHRQTTLDLLSRLGENSDFDSGVCSGGLCDKFRQQATEFTLYLVYAARIASFDCIHAIEERPWGDELSISVWRGDSQGLAVQVKAIAEHSELNGHPFFFGLQSGALNGIGGEARFSILEDLFTIYVNASVYDWDSWDDMANCIG